jgi:dihydrolipoamide dehydrogenase
MAEQFDAVVIGGGPGGYNAAIRLGQLGLKAACIDKRGRFGGTCLNVGCIPSKALLHVSERLEEASKEFAKLGIKAQVSLDLNAMMAHKDKVVGELTKGVEFLLKKNKIDAVHAKGRIAAAGKVEVTGPDGKKQTLETKAIVIATGSEVAALPGITIDEKTVVSSTGALSLASVPKRLVVIGGGYIGLELGSVWSRLGSDVTVVEMLDRLAPGLDGEVAKQLQRVLTKQGLAFKLGTKVVSVETKGKSVKLTLEPAGGGKSETLDCDVVLVAVGRVPNTQGLGLAELHVKTDNRGRIVVDEKFAASVPGIYAIGDVIKGPMLAHKAEDEGIAVAEILAGQAGHVNYDVIPSVIYTAPEVASVGRTEEDLKAAGIDYKVGKFPFTANGRAKVNRTTDGFVKVLADAATDRVLGVHIIGPHAGEMIGECSVIMEFGGSAEDLARTCHAHPTLTEAIKEAAMAVDKRAVHM